jgi:hypothetical protein
MCRRLMKAWLRGSMPCLPLVATPMGIAAVGADMVYLAQQQKCDGCTTTGIGGATHGVGGSEPSSGIDRSVAEPIDQN